MKIRSFFLSLLCLCVMQVQGQDDDCAARIAEIEALIAAKSYDSAFDLWKSTSKCVSESRYRSGEKILKHNLTTPLSDSDRAGQTAMLLKLYSDYDRDFPANANGNAIKKALFLYAQDKSNTEVLPLLDRAFNQDRDHFTDANALQLYFDLFYNHALQQPDQTMAPFQIIGKRDELLAQAEKLFSATGNNDFRMIAASIKRQAAPVANCENLEKFYGNEIGLERNKNASWLKTTALNLATDCPRSQIYYQVASDWYTLEANAKSAYHLAQASQFRRKSGDAVKYYTIAAQTETDPVQKAEIYYTLAMRQITDAPTALSMLKEALKAKPDFGKAYLLMAEIYSSVDCGKTTFEKKAPFLLAAETALKAGKADASLKKTAEGFSAGYRKKAPSASEIKEAKMNGKTITIGCGINETVTFPQ